MAATNKKPKESIVESCTSSSSSSSSTLTVRKSLKQKVEELFVNLPNNIEVPGHRGYRIDGNYCKGAVNVLGECFYKINFKPVAKRRGKIKSSCETGTLVHRHIYHEYHCKPKRCMCLQRFNKKSIKLHENSQTSAFIEAFKKFIKDVQWKVFACELIVGCVDVGCGTAIDVVCVDDLDTPTEFYVIEIKTGSRACLHSGRTTDKTGMMVGHAGRKIKNSYANHHQLQLWFECEALKQTYDIKASQAVVLYLEPTGEYKACYAESWWFDDKKMQAQMYAQLCGAT